MAMSFCKSENSVKFPWKDHTKIIWMKWNTLNANKVDNSVSKWDESHESKARQTLMFCFDSASQQSLGNRFSETRFEYVSQRLQVVLFSEIWKSWKFPVNFIWHFYVVWIIPVPLVVKSYKMVASQRLLVRSNQHGR